MCKRLPRSGWDARSSRSRAPTELRGELRSGLPERNGARHSALFAASARSLRLRPALTALALFASPCAAAEAASSAGAPWLHGAARRMQESAGAPEVPADGAARDMLCTRMVTRFEECDQPIEGSADGLTMAHMCPETCENLRPLNDNGLTMATLNRYSESCAGLVAMFGCQGGAYDPSDFDRSLADDATLADVCPEQCGGGNLEATSPFAQAATVAATCGILLALDGGCAHDLSLNDRDVAAGTLVSEVCPRECSGHGDCERSVADISFLDDTRDSSGMNNQVLLQGDACVDHAGVRFDGQSSVRVNIEENYADGDGFTISTWMLRDRADVWVQGGIESETFFSHPSATVADVDSQGGIRLEIARKAWLTTWKMVVHLDEDTCFDCHKTKDDVSGNATLSLLSDELPRWTHVAIIKSGGELTIFEDTILVSTVSDELISLFRGRSLSEEVLLGGDGTTSGFVGRLAMVKIHPTALSTEQLSCVYESGFHLVRSGLLTERHPCQGEPVIGGCSSAVATNMDASTVHTLSADDGSCLFEPNGRVSVEAGTATVSTEWQRVYLQHAYRHPVVFCGAPTRNSTAQSVVHIRGMLMDPKTQIWQFQIRTEQKLCRLTSQRGFSRVNFLVVESGASVEGWQVGLVRVRDKEWHRVSYLREFAHHLVGSNSSTPVVVAQVQTDVTGNRTQFVSVGLQTQLGSADTAARDPAAFFLRVQGTGVWCPDGEFFAQVFSNPNLGGNPSSTSCQPAPQWPLVIPQRAAADTDCCRDGLPPVATASGSIRWTGRVNVPMGESHPWAFRSQADGGVRVAVDGSVVLDSWGGACDSTSQCNAEVKTSDPVVVDGGYHILSYEVSGPWSSAALSWRRLGVPRNSNTTSQNAVSAVQFYEDVAWLACPAGRQLGLGASFEAGYSSIRFEKTIAFAKAYSDSVPTVLATIASSNSLLEAHLRLLAATP
eukprot:COSAG04_NODE_1888_length_5302_cov_7.916682_3_plen_950_part_01